MSDAQLQAAPLITAAPQGVTTGVSEKIRKKLRDDLDFLRRRTSTMRIQLSRDIQSNNRVLAGAPYNPVPTGQLSTTSYMRIDPSRTENRHIVNIVKPRIIAAANLASALLPTPAAMPISEDPAALEKAQIGERWLQDTTEENLSILTFQRNVLQSLCHGRAILRDTWDFDGGPEALDADGRPLGHATGAPYYEPMHPLSLLVSPDETDPERWTLVGVEYRQKRVVAELLYNRGRPFKQDEVNAIPGTGEIRDALRTSARLVPTRPFSLGADGGEPLYRDEPDYVYVTELYELEALGRVVRFHVFVGDHLVHTQEGGPFKHNRLPYTILDYFNIPDVANPTSLVAEQRPIQTRWIINDNQLLNHIDSMAVAKVLVHKMSGLDIARLRGWPGEILYHDAQRPEQMPQFVKGTPAPADLWMLSERLIQMADQVAGTNSAVFGQREPGERSARQPIARQQAAMGQAEFFIRRVHASMEAIYRKTWGMALENLRGHATVRYYEAGKLRHSWLYAQDLTEGRAISRAILDVKLKSAPLAPFDKIAQEQQLREDWMGGIFGWPPVAPESVAKYLQAKRKAGLPVTDIETSAETPEEQFARAEERMIVMGVPIPTCAGLNSPELAQAFLKEHGKSLQFAQEVRGQTKGGRAPSIPDPVKDTLTAHIQQLQAALQGGAPAPAMPGATPPSATGGAGAL